MRAAARVWPSAAEKDALNHGRIRNPALAVPLSAEGSDEPGAQSSPPRLPLSGKRGHTAPPPAAGVTPVSRSRARIRSGKAAATPTLVCQPGAGTRAGRIRPRCQCRSKCVPAAPVEKWGLADLAGLRPG